MEDPETNRKESLDEEVTSEQEDVKCFCCYKDDEVRTMDTITSSTVIFTIIAMIIVLIILLARH